MERLYVVVRADLPTPQQAVQAVHAAQAFAVEHPAAHLSWYRGSNTLALLSVADESSLLGLSGKARMRGVPSSLFREPDRGNEATAVVNHPRPEGRGFRSRPPTQGLVPDVQRL